MTFSPSAIVAAILLLFTISPTWAQTNLPGPCQTSINNATVVLQASASSSAINASAFQAGDPVVALTPNEETCTGQTTLNPQSNESFPLAEADPQSGAPGYEEGDTLVFWGQADSGDIYILTPTFASCSNNDPLCVDEPVYQRNGVYTIEDLSVTVLPVEFVGWRARVDARRVVLEWETASETDNSGFYILQRGPEAETWRELGFVEGNGTTQTPNSYSFTTSDLAPGDYSFRLRQVDVDGASTLSAPITARINTDRATLQSARPHPVTSTSTVQLTVPDAQNVNVRLYDILGRHVGYLYRGPATPGQPIKIAIEGRDLSPGTYIVVATGTSFRETQRVTIAR
jgi:hypothetical protein